MYILGHAGLIGAYISYFCVVFRHPYGPVDAHGEAWSAHGYKAEGTGDIWGPYSELSGSLLGSFGWLSGILGSVFADMLAGMFGGADLASKLVYLGMENVCFLCNSHQNHHFGEIGSRSAFPSFWEAFWEAFGSLGGSFGLPGGIS